MKTFKFNKNIVEYEDDAKFDGNQFINSVYGREKTILNTICDICFCGIAIFLGIKIASPKKNK